MYGISLSLQTILCSVSYVPIVFSTGSAGKVGQLLLGLVPFSKSFIAALCVNICICQCGKLISEYLHLTCPLQYYGFLRVCLDLMHLVLPRVLCRQRHCLEVGKRQCCNTTLDLLKQRTMLLRLSKIVFRKRLDHSTSPRVGL